MAFARSRAVLKDSLNRRSEQAVLDQPAIVRSDNRVLVRRLSVLQS
jgi:hypothetical protein